MNQLPENSLRIYDVTLVTSYLIGLGMSQPRAGALWTYCLFTPQIHF